MCLRCLDLPCSFLNTQRERANPGGFLPSSTPSLELKNTYFHKKRKPGTEGTPLQPLRGEGLGLETLRRCLKRSGREGLGQQQFQGPRPGPARVPLPWNHEPGLTAERDGGGHSPGLHWDGGRALGWRLPQASGPALLATSRLVPRLQKQGHWAHGRFSTRVVFSRRSTLSLDVFRCHKCVCARVSVYV